MKVNQQLSIKAVMNLVVIEPADGNLQVDKLWPQLWAMGQVHPIVADLVDDIYDEYILILEDLLNQRVYAKANRYTKEGELIEEYETCDLIKQLQKQIA
mgnify:CR=1 FL=1